MRCVVPAALCSFYTGTCLTWVDMLSTYSRTPCGRPSWLACAFRACSTAQIALTIPYAFSQILLHIHVPSVRVCLSVRLKIQALPVPSGKWARIASLESDFDNSGIGYIPYALPTNYSHSSTNINTSSAFSHGNPPCRREHPKGHMVSRRMTQYRLEGNGAHRCNCDDLVPSSIIAPAKLRLQYPCDHGVYATSNVTNMAIWSSAHRFDRDVCSLSV